jgi:uncharacterized protein
MTVGSIDAGLGEQRAPAARLRVVPRLPLCPSWFVVALLITVLTCPQVLLPAAWANPVANTLPVPALKGRVNDTAAVLTASERERLSDLLANYERETHHQLAVLTIPSLAGEPLEAYSLRVANTWGLGLKGYDDGILVMLAMKECKIRIELGKGMERYISKAQAKAIIDESVVPAFRKGDWAGGLQNGLQRLMTDARRYVVNPSDSPGK